MLNKINLILQLQYNLHERDVIGLTIGDPFVAKFAPVDVCDEPLLRLLSPNSVSTEQYAKVIMEQRKDVAEDLAHILTEKLMEEMSKRDTINGYPIEKGDNVKTG